MFLQMIYDNKLNPDKTTCKNVKYVLYKEANSQQ